MFGIFEQKFLHSFLANLDQQTKAHTSSPTRSLSSEPIKKSILREISSLSVTPASPSPSPPPPSASASSTTDEILIPTVLPLPLNITQSLSYPYDTTPGKSSEINRLDRVLNSFSLGVKVPEAPLVFQSLPISSDEIEPHPSTKRPHVDETSESVHILSSISEIDEQFSPSKRARRSVSSQESIETFRYHFSLSSLATYLFLFLFS